MALSAGAGPLILPHLDDSGFWMFKGDFNMSIRETLLTWALMETIISVVALPLVLLLNIVIV